VVALPVPAIIETYSFLENNIYGVDLNEESVGDCTNSLYGVRIRAQPRRKANDLRVDIKCWESLMRQLKLLLEYKAFKWDIEFPDILGNGDFDACY